MSELHPQKFSPTLTLTPEQKNETLEQRLAREEKFRGPATEARRRIKMAFPYVVHPKE